MDGIGELILSLLCSTVILAPTSILLGYQVPVLALWGKYFLIQINTTRPGPFLLTSVHWVQGV